MLLQKAIGGGKLYNCKLKLAVLKHGRVLENLI